MSISIMRIFSGAFLVLCATASLARTVSQDIEDSLPLKTKLQSIEKIAKSNPRAGIRILTAISSDRLLNEAVEIQMSYYEVLSQLYNDLSLFGDGESAARKGLALISENTIGLNQHIRLLINLGFAQEHLGHLLLAKGNYYNALRLAELNDNSLEIARAQINIGAILYTDYHFEESLEYLNNAYEMAAILMDKELSALVNSELGILYDLMGKINESIEYQKKSLNLYISIGHTYYAMYESYNLGVAYLALEKWREAEMFFEQTLSFGGQSIDATNRYYALMGLASAFRGQRRFLKALDYLKKAQSIQHLIDSSIAISEFHLVKSKLLFDMEDYSDALTSIDKAISLKRETLTNSTQSAILRWQYIRVKILEKLGDIEQAFIQLEEIYTQAKGARERDRERRNIEMRVKFESERQEIEKAILAKDNAIKALQLSQSKNQLKIQLLVILIVGFLVVVLSYLLIKQFQSRKLLSTLVNIDSLTGAYNRRYLFNSGRKLLSIAQNKDRMLSVLLLDIDDFKGINDTYGHGIGDDIIQLVASHSMESLRSRDLFGRIGGEEFIAIMPDADESSAKRVAERVRKGIMKIDYAVSNNSLKLTASIGVSTATSTSQTFEQLVNEADKAMYHAKKNGKNQVASFDAVNSI